MCFRAVSQRKKIFTAISSIRAEDAAMPSFFRCAKNPAMCSVVTAAGVQPRERMSPIT